MKIKSQRDFVAGLMFVMVGVVFAVGARAYPMGTSASPGAGYFPLALSMLLAILGLVVLFRSLTVGSAGQDRIGQVAWKPLLIIVASIGVFGFALPRLGMFLAFPLLVLMVSCAGGQFAWKGVLTSCVVLTAFSWFVFIWGLNLTIPMVPTFLAG